MRQQFVVKKSSTCFLVLMLALAFAGNAYGAKTQPTITGLDTTSGPSLGGTEVVITGTNFAAGATVTFNGVLASVVTETPPTTIKVNTPLSAKGLADVTVTNPNGDNDKLTRAFEFIHPGDGVFEYGIDPTLNKIMPPDSGSSMDAEAGDIDGDGDLDYVVADETYGNNSVRLYENDGSANFNDISTNVPSVLVQDGRPMAITLGDLNGDLHLDIIVVGTFKPGQFYLNNGDRPATFSNASANFPQELTDAWGVDLGDFNNDGHLDIYIANYGPDNLYLNNREIPPAQPTFTDASATLPSNSEQSEDCIVADVNDDDWDDIYITNYSSDNSLYLNNGTDPISFTKATLPPEPADANGDVWYGSRDAVLVDLDKDNDLDIVVANHNYNQNRLYLNDGSRPVPTFTDATATSLPQIWDNSHDVKAGDVDGDGDVDLVFANQNIWLDPVNPNPATVTNNNSLYLNNGDNPPTFSYATATHMPAGDLGIQSWDVILGDMDNDDDLDIIFTNAGPLYDGLRQDQLYLNTP